MAKRGHARTLADDVFVRMREAILAGRLEPGSRLRPAELREEFNVSIGVVREALTRLSGQHLVVAEPNSGFAVASLSRHDLDDITEARIGIEGYTLRLSIAKGDARWEMGVVAAHHRLSVTPVFEADGSVNPAWSEPHEAFHIALLSACGNSHLLAICESLFRSGELYRLWAHVTPSAGDAVERHGDIMRAALSRDADLAVELLSEHLEHGRALALETIAPLDRSL